MSTQQLYKIVHASTNDWDIISPEARKLTKEQCNILLKNLIDEGFNPNHLRAIPDND